MAESAMTYVLNWIRHQIPVQMLELAFLPRKFNTTIEQRIISEIVEGCILQDTNLVGGKRREIVLESPWLLDIEDPGVGFIPGTGITGSFYLVPPEAREFRNISSVIGITPFVGAGLPGAAGTSQADRLSGNTAMGLLSEMLNTRTFNNYPITPQVSLEGTNIIRFFPSIITSGINVSVMLEYDSEFININASSIIALRELCLCATMRYIGTKLRVTVDESEIVAGMEIGVVKTLVEQYVEKGENYSTLLTKLKGAMLYDSKAVNRLIYHML